MNDESKKEYPPYEPPAIIFEQTVEAIAGVCSSGFDGIDTCRYSNPSCATVNI